MSDDQDDIVIDADLDNEGVEATPEQKLKKLRDTVKKVQAERDEHLAGWQRAKADYINLQRRMQQSGEELSKAGVAALAVDLIAVFDSLEAAHKAAIAKGAGDDGAEAVMKQLLSVLERHGVIRVVPKEGDHFDPTNHEAVMTVATETQVEDNTIAAVLQSGFTFMNVTLRPARVTVKHYQ